MKLIKKFLDFLSLLDLEGRLSITNLSVYICLGKIIVTPSLSIVDIGTLFLTLLNYSHKRYVLSKAPEEAPSAIPGIDTTEVSKQLEDLKSTVNGLVVRIGMGR